MRSSVAPLQSRLRLRPPEFHAHLAKHDQFHKFIQEALKYYQVPSPAWPLQLWPFEHGGTRSGGTGELAGLCYWRSPFPGRS
jgi:hypothetical protein